MEKRGTISLIINETDYYSGLVVGKLELATDYLKFGINHNKEFSTFALADLIKMNRDCFESKEISMELVKKLKNFEIKLEQVKQAKTEASIAQRGLALSQRALQETRDALREATESATSSKAGLGSFKK